MATNPYNNKVQLADGTVLIDLSSDTVTPQTMIRNTTAHNAAGASISGVVDLANAGTSVPLADSSSGSAGVSNDYSREDHVHPRDAVLENQVWRNSGFLAPYGTSPLIFIKDGTTIKFHCERYMALNIFNYSWKMVLNNDALITVPHDRFAVYNNSNESIEVKTENEFKVLDNTKYYLLFYNSNGQAVGDWAQYLQITEEIPITMNQTSGTVKLIKNGRIRQLIFDDAVVPASGSIVFDTPLNELDRPITITSGVLYYSGNGSSFILSWIRTNGTIGYYGISSGMTISGTITWLVAS